MSYANYSELKANKPVKWWHESIVDDMLAFPLSTLEERCKRLGRYTVSHLSIIINSDMFKAYYQKRRAEYERSLDEQLIHKTAKAADKALDLLLERMDEKRTAIPFNTLAEFADKSLQRLGYGNSNGKAAVQVNVDSRSVTVSKEELATARQTLRAVESERAALLPPQPPPSTEPEEV